MADGPQSIYAPLSNGDTKKSAAEPQRHAPSPLVPRPKRALGLAALAFSAIYWILSQPYVSEDGASLLRGYCANVPSITSHEFGTRQTWLGETLQALGGGSFLAEPGASAGYFANLSGTHWHLSERPLLLLVSPSEDGKDAQVTVLTPFFEATRAKMLPIAAKHISWVEWPEDADPYTTLLASLPVLARGRPVYIDRNARHFVATGLAHAGADVQPAPVAVRALRERKSAAELALMRCANEATLLAIRHVRGKMSLGVRESQVRAWITEALAEAGLTSTWSVILFGDNAALPHGTGSDRTLGKQDLALIDAGGNLRGYSSDVTRTFALHESEIPQEHLDIWKLVHLAQAAALATATNGTVASMVDAAARSTIAAAGYGRYFTHRLGHGIGLETHESPYLVGGSAAVLASGHTFSDEPGVYIEGKVGVRLEDCFVVSEDGTPAYLTQKVGGAAQSPWDP